MSGYVLCFLLYFSYSTIVQKFGRVGNSKRARCLSEPRMLIHYKQKQITNNLKQNAKMNNRMIQITDAKVRGFWADSKKFA